MTPKPQQNKGFQRNIRLRCWLFDGMKKERAARCFQHQTALTETRTSGGAGMANCLQYTDSESVYKDGFHDRLAVFA